MGNNADLTTSIRQLAEKHNEYIVDWRRWFHQHPELSLQEKETTDAIVFELEKLGIPVSRFSGLYGCVGELRGERPGLTVLLRADIDALPVQEKTGLPFSSVTSGRMHACGHDNHAAMLLGAAKILSELKADICGSVRFFFQSGEETAWGAKLAVDQGVMDDVDACFGMHVWGTIDSPGFSLQSGERMASCDTFTLTVHGYSVHGAMPHMGNDAIVATAAIIMNIQSIVSRGTDPLDALIITIGTIHGGQRFNIVADQVELGGTVRTFNRELRAGLESRIRELAETTAKAFGCTIELQYEYKTDPVINDSDILVNIAQNAAARLYGDILTHSEKSMISEDFSYLSESAPGVYGFLGGHSKDVPGSGLSNHNDAYTVDESVLHRGAAISAQFAFDFLSDGAEKYGIEKKAVSED